MIIELTNATDADSSLIGTKAAILGELLRAGLKVPPGFVLTTAAYAEFLAPLRERIRARLTENVIMDPAEIESAAEGIRAELQALPFPEALETALETALGGIRVIDKPSLIARTSTPSEDLATSFGSGVARAYPGLVGVNEVERAAARCWAALWNSRAMYYRHRKKIDQTAVALAVLVQPMVNADSAGVMFTRDPMGGAEDEIVIHSIWGLGSPLMGARIRPDEFRVAKATSEIRDRTIEEHVVKLVVGADGHTEEQAVAAELVNAPSLTDAQVVRLAELGREIEGRFGTPQDLEWAVSNGEIFVLQARPMQVRTS